MAASGIAANPVSNVGGPAMMAAGGIVPGYALGTLVRSGFGAAKNFYLVEDHKHTELELFLQ